MKSGLFSQAINKTREQWFIQNNTLLLYLNDDYISLAFGGQNGNGLQHVKIESTF